MKLKSKHIGGALSKNTKSRFPILTDFLFYTSTINTWQCFLNLSTDLMLEKHLQVWSMGCTVSPQSGLSLGKVHQRHAALA